MRFAVDRRFDASRDSRQTETEHDDALPDHPICRSAASFASSLIDRVLPRSRGRFDVRAVRPFVRSCHATGIVSTRDYLKDLAFGLAIFCSVACRRAVTLHPAVKLGVPALA